MLVDACGHGLVMTADALRAGLGSSAALADFGELWLWCWLFLAFRGDFASLVLVVGRAFALSKRELVGRPKERIDKTALTGRQASRRLTGDPGEAVWRPSARASVDGL